MTSNNLQIGKEYYQQGKYIKSLEYLNKALEHFKETKDSSKELGDCNYFFGLIYERQGKSEKALFHFQEAEKIYKVKGTLKDKTGVYFNLGYVLFQLYNYEESLYNYKKSLEINNDNFQFFKGLTLQNIGVIYANQNMNSKALKIYKESITIFQNLGETVHVMTVKGNIGILLNVRKTGLEALKYLKEAWVYFKEKGLENKRSIKILKMNIDEIEKIK